MGEPDELGDLADAAAAAGSSSSSSDAPVGHRHSADGPEPTSNAPATSDSLKYQPRASNGSEAREPPGGRQPPTRAREISSRRRADDSVAREPTGCVFGASQSHEWRRCLWQGTPIARWRRRRRWRLKTIQDETRERRYSTHAQGPTMIIFCN